MSISSLSIIVTILLLQVKSAVIISDTYYNYKEGNCSSGQNVANTNFYERGTPSSTDKSTVGTVIDRYIILKID